jgi:hypothetical protein
VLFSDDLSKEDHRRDLREGYFFFSLAASRAIQEISIVYALAELAISAVFISLFGSEVWYGTTLLSRKSRSAPVLIAKFMFSGISPVAFVWCVRSLPAHEAAPLWQAALAEVAAMAHA